MLMLFERLILVSSFLGVLSFVRLFFPVLEGALLLIDNVPSCLKVIVTFLKRFSKNFEFIFKRALLPHVCLHQQHARKKLNTWFTIAVLTQANDFCLLDIKVKNGYVKIVIVVAMEHKKIFKTFKY